MQQLTSTADWIKQNSFSEIKNRNFEIIQLEENKTKQKEKDELKLM